MGPSAGRRLALAAAFVRAAHVYWLVVFPQARTQLSEWRRRATAIPDPVLRQLALSTLANEMGNLEGAAAFATFAPPRARRAVIRAAVAFQTIYDYVDTLVEQPAADPIANGRALHEALVLAVMPSGSQPNYYAHHPQDDDGGYLANLVDVCREALATLPSYTGVEQPAQRAAARMVEYQTLIHASASPDATTSLQAWATATTPPDADLHWWETAAAAASSLLVFALIAAAAQADLRTAEILPLEAAYFPWIGALHVLLDSLVDQQDDEQSHHYSLVRNYGTPAHAAARMSWIARSAQRRVDTLHDHSSHRLLLVAMSSFYLASASAADTHAALATDSIANSLGALARPIAFLLRVHATLRASPRH